MPKSRPRLRDLGITIGVLPAGPLNAITDVPCVRVGHVTRVEGDSIRTGATAILPHDGNVFQQKVPAAIYVGNGFGKFAGSTQIEELGQLETPVILTNTLSVAPAIDALVEYTLIQPGNENVRSVNAVVGETNDSHLNDIRRRLITRDDVLRAIASAQPGPVAEGCVGAGTGTVCFGFKGGIGTSSRLLPESLGGYTVATLAQTNFGGVLQINGILVGQHFNHFSFSEELLQKADGSCVLVVATDAPLCPRNLRRLAKRAFMGLARTGGIASHGSGDYVLAFSTHPDCRIPHSPNSPVRQVPTLHDDHVTPLFLAAIESAEEAIISSLFTATPTSGHEGRHVDALPVDKILPLLKR